MSNSYDVYIGNLSVTISREKLRELFCEVGEILFVWVKQGNLRFTYAFVAFYHLSDAKQACEIFNNQNIDGFVIRVNLSIKTQRNLNSCVKKKTNNPGIILELPKRTMRKIPTVEDNLRKILADQLKSQNRNFVSNFMEAMVEAENVSLGQCEIIKTEPEKTNLETLENIVIRYFKPCKKRTLFKEIDFDISKGNVLGSDQNKKYFNIFDNLKNQ